MKQTSHERKLLNQIAEAREDLRGFRRGKISQLLHDIDAVEQEVKSVGAIGKNTKAAYQQYYSELDTIKTKITKLHVRRFERFLRGGRVVALGFVLLFLFLYIFAGVKSKSVPTNIQDEFVWGAIGIAASVLTYIIFMVNFDVYVFLTIRLPNKYIPGKTTLLVKFYGLVIYYLLIFSYLNTYFLLFSLTQSWAYPFLSTLINGILQGETLSLIWAFFTVVSIIIGLIGGVLSIVDFFEKRRYKKSK